MRYRREIDEEVQKYMDELLKKKIKTFMIKVEEQPTSFGDKVADKIAEGAGSWSFIIGFTLVIIGWIILNVANAYFHFDPYPFILLNLALSCLAAIQAPIIMMSQNRHDKKDRIRDEHDFETNMKSEILSQETLKYVRRIEEIEDKIDELIKKIDKLEITNNNIKK